MRLQEVNVNVTGEGGEDRTFQRLLRRAREAGRAPRRPRSVRHLQAAAPGGAAAAATSTPNSRRASWRSPPPQRGLWNIDYDTGIRYRYGEVQFQGSQIEEAYLRTFFPSRQAEHYDAESARR